MGNVSITAKFLRICHGTINDYFRNACLCMMQLFQKIIASTVNDSILLEVSADMSGMNVEKIWLIPIL
jgi:hypothetical protein